MEERVKELLADIDEARQEAMSHAESASSEAYTAKHSADSAVDYAENARDEASQAEESADDCVRRLKDLDGFIAELNQILSEGDDGEASLTVMLKKYGPTIRKLKSQGCTSREIAERLKISEVIVNIALERQEAA